MKPVGTLSGRNKRYKSLAVYYLTWLSIKTLPHRANRHSMLPTLHPATPHSTPLLHTNPLPYPAPPTDLSHWQTTCPEHCRSHRASVNMCSFQVSQSPLLIAKSKSIAAAALAFFRKATHNYSQCNYILRDDTAAKISQIYFLFDFGIFSFIDTFYLLGNFKAWTSSSNAIISFQLYKVSIISFQLLKLPLLMWVVFLTFQLPLFILKLYGSACGKNTA